MWSFGCTDDLRADVELHVADDLGLPVVTGVRLRGVDDELVRDLEAEPAWIDRRVGADLEEDDVQHRSRAARIEDDGHPRAAEQVVRLGQERGPVEAGAAPAVERKEVAGRVVDEARELVGVQRAADVRGVQRVGRGNARPLDRSEEVERVGDAGDPFEVCDREVVDDLPRQLVGERVQLGGRDAGSGASGLEGGAEGLECRDQCPDRVRERQPGCDRLREILGLERRRQVDDQLRDVLELGDERLRAARERGVTVDRRRKGEAELGEQQVDLAGVEAVRERREQGRERPRDPLQRPTLRRQARLPDRLARERRLRCLPGPDHLVNRVRAQQDVAQPRAVLGERDA